MRFDLAGVTDVELAVDQRVQQYFGVVAGHLAALPFRRSQADAQHRPRAREARHHRADRRADDVGDLAIVEIVDLAQHQRLAERIRRAPRSGAAPSQRRAAQRLRFRRLRLVAP